MWKKDEKSETELYIMGWCILAALVLLVIFLRVTGMRLSQLLGPCMIHTFTGYYCPGCGGTRAVHALFSGNLLRSFLYHPAVLYIAVFGTWFMVSQTVQRLSRGKIRIAMHFRTGYLWVALGLIVVNFLIKNLALLIFHVDLMA